MKPASFLRLGAVLALLLASTSAIAAPGASGAPKKKKPKSSVTTTKAPKKADKKPAPVADTETDPAPTAPETKAADAKPADAQPVPVAPGAAPESDRPGSGARRDEGDDASRPFVVAPLMGFGTKQFNFGLGARAGYTLPARVYFGAAFMYHFGSTYGFGASEASVRIFYPSGEVGYDFHVGAVTIRPYGGVGLAVISVSSTFLGETKSASDTSLVIYPGATAHWNIPRSAFFVGGDTRMVIATRGGDPSFGLFATAGMKF